MNYGHGFFGDKKNKYGRSPQQSVEYSDYKQLWELSDEHKLRDLVKLKVNINRICFELKRPKSSVISKMRELGRRYKRITNRKTYNEKDTTFDLLKKYILNLRSVSGGNHVPFDDFKSFLERRGRGDKIGASYFRKRKDEVMREILAEEGKWFVGIEETYLIPYKREMRREENRDGRKEQEERESE